MKVIETSQPVKQRFVGTRHECCKCFVVFEIETVEDVQDVHANGLGMVMWAGVECPSCHESVTVTTFVRFVGDTNDVCRPIRA